MQNHPQFLRSEVLGYGFANMRLKPRDNRWMDKFRCWHGINGGTHRFRSIVRCGVTGVFCVCMFLFGRSTWVGVGCCGWDRSVGSGGFYVIGGCDACCVCDVLKVFH